MTLSQCPRLEDAQHAAAELAAFYAESTGFNGKTFAGITKRGLHVIEIRNENGTFFSFWKED